MNLIDTPQIKTFPYIDPRSHNCRLAFRHHNIREGIFFILLYQVVVSLNCISHWQIWSLLYLGFALFRDCFIYIHIFQHVLVPFVDLACLFFAGLPWRVVKKWSNSRMWTPSWTRLADRCCLTFVDCWMIFYFIFYLSWIFHVSHRSFDSGVEETVKLMFYFWMFLPAYVEERKISSMPFRVEKWF